jgi:ribonuclease HII
VSPTGPRRPSLRVERALQRDGHRVLAGMDEVGRGALAGPVTVGVVVIDETCRTAPQGVKDSKLLAPHARERMVPRIERWALGHAVGHASADEIDEIGIIAALRLAGCRALATVAATGIRPDLVILDGNHDWLTSPEDVGLLAFAHEDRVDTPPVTTMIKADLKCSSVAAASVLAKVTRDRIMVDLGADGAYAGYGWVENKGYAAPEHLDALRRLGPCDLHRRSWRLPGTMDDDDGMSVRMPPEAFEAFDTAPDAVVADADVADAADAPYLTSTDLTRVGER